MNLGTYGILIVFAAFIILLILNPKLSCFGRRVRSPFYPILRRRRKNAPPQDTTDKAEKKGDDYGFRLD